MVVPERRAFHAVHAVVHEVFAYKHCQVFALGEFDDRALARDVAQPDRHRDRRHEGCAGNRVAVAKAGLHWFVAFVARHGDDARELLHVRAIRDIILFGPGLAVPGIDT